MSNNTILSNHLQPLLFNFFNFECLFFKPSEKELEVQSYWNSIYNLLPVDIRYEEKARTGRPCVYLRDILAVWIVKEIYNMKTITATITTIKDNPNLMTILGLETIPSASVISRKTKSLEKNMNFNQIHDTLCASFYKDHCVGHLSIDSTIIEAREKPTAIEVEVKKEKKEKKKRGRKKKGSAEEAAYKRMLEEKQKQKDFQEKGDIQAYIAKHLNDKCSITGKKNSKGYMQWKIGYKVHLAVDDFGIPVSYVVTGANVHDSKVAVTLLRLAQTRCTFFYTLMDGGYSSSDIERFASSIDVVPIIDLKADRNGHKREMDKAKKKRYEARTTVERTNSEMKECFLPFKLYSRKERASFEINLAVLLTTIKKMDNVIKKKLETQAQRTA